MMDCGNIANWVGAIAQVIAAVATGVAAYYAAKAAKISEKVAENSESSSQLEIFLKFSEEYDRIKDKYDRLHAYLNYDGGSSGLSAANTTASLSTLKLFEREYFLWRKNMIQNQTWLDIFEPKILKFLKLKATEYVWSQRGKYKAYDFSDAFETYVTEKMKA